MSDRPTRVLFAVRQSPDWSHLAARFAAGEWIDPAAYVPARHVPTFPPRIAACIAAWNRGYAVDFFACRAALKTIAAETLAAVADGAVFAAGNWPADWPATPFRLFFLDDDDWFAPDTAARIALVGAEDVAVFPLLRLDVPVFTFVRLRRPESPVIGLAGGFSNRYQTNNYGLHPRLCTPERLTRLADHIAACAEAERMGLSDGYYDVMLSATNKTPVSASVLERIEQDPAVFRARVVAFVAALRTITLPAHAAWMASPIRRTADLFARALG